MGRSLGEKKRSLAIDLKPHLPRMCLVIATDAEYAPYREMLIAALNRHGCDGRRGKQVFRHINY